MIELKTTYVIETRQEICGGCINKKEEFDSLEKLECAIKDLPKSKYIKEAYKKTKLVF